MNEFILAMLGLAFAGCVGFVIGRKSLWQRVETAEAAVKAAARQAQDDAFAARLGQAVYGTVKEVLLMSECIGAGMGYARTGHITLEGHRPSKITFEVEA